MRIDMTRDDHGYNFTLEDCEELSPHVANFLHALLHGKHDEALHDATGRNGDEIECVYIHTEKVYEEGGGVYAYLHLAVEFLEAPPWMDKPERTDIQVTFGYYYGDERVSGMLVAPGTNAPCELSGVRYDVAIFHNTLDEVHHFFVKTPEQYQDAHPAPPPLTVVPCDDDLPF
jgi:hypothetical protein